MYIIYIYIYIYIYIIIIELSLVPKTVLDVRSQVNRAEQCEKWVIERLQVLLLSILEVSCLY